MMSDHLDCRYIIIFSSWIYTTKTIHEPSSVFARRIIIKCIKSVQPSKTSMQESSSVLASSSKLYAVNSVQPATTSIQVPSSVFTEGSKLNALESVHPSETGIHEPLSGIYINTINTCYWIRVTIIVIIIIVKRS